MNKKIAVIVLGLGLMPPSVFAGDELTGDTKLACEAILCLSSGDRPSECAPSIRKFFSIYDKKPHKTIQKRKNFLALCPVGESQGMPEYQDLLANNAEKCSASRLNRDLLEKKVVQKWRGSHNDGVYIDVIYYRISNKLPGYCESFYSHEYNQAVPKYVGSNEWVSQYIWNRNKNQFGHWAD